MIEHSTGKFRVVQSFVQIHLHVVFVMCFAIKNVLEAIHVLKSIIERSIVVVFKTNT